MSWSAVDDSASAPERRSKPTIESAPGLPDVKIIRAKVFPDNRGYFSESYNVDEWREELGFVQEFKQDNHSYSKANVLRGLHSQPGMAKLVSCIVGSIFDVAVDARIGSPTYGRHVTRILNDTSHEHFFVPDGFLHGFLVLSTEAHVVYKLTGTHNPSTEFGINPFDATLAIEWPIDRSKMVISERDSVHPDFTTLKGQ